jgi:hypothetical protein
MYHSMQPTVGSFTSLLTAPFDEEVFEVTKMQKSKYIKYFEEIIKKTN